MLFGAKKKCKPGWDPSTLPSALQTRSAMKRVVWAQESEVGNEVRGLLNPLLVRPSACPLVRPVCAPSALMRPSARPPVRLHSACRPPVRLSATHPPSVCPSAPRPPVHLSFAPRPPVRPSAPPFAPSAFSKNYLSFSSAPKFFTSCTPREIATFAILGASKSYSGIEVSKFPPLRGQP